MNEEKLGGRRKRVAIGIILVGFLTALVIYAFSGKEADDPALELEHTKKFTHDLERLGGKYAVWANDFNHWVAGLMHGEALAYTVACITIVLAGAYYFISARLND